MEFEGNILQIGIKSEYKRNLGTFNRSLNPLRTHTHTHTLSLSLSLSLSHYQGVLMCSMATSRLTLSLMSQPLPLEALIRTVSAIAVCV